MLALTKISILFYIQQLLICVFLQKFVCPRHICHMCAANADDVGDSLARTPPFTRCLRCPTTYHTGKSPWSSLWGSCNALLLMRCQLVDVYYLVSSSSSGEGCMAAGTEEISQTSHICTKHLQLPKNLSHHVNVNWCFCCSKVSACIGIDFVM